MCMAQSNIKGLDIYNWDGDEIVHECIVPSHRSVSGFSEKKNYNIDVREFLVSEKNELMRRVLREDMKKFIKRELHGEWNFFRSRDEGSFDYRANVIAAFIAEKIHYTTKRIGEPWLFPDETLFVEAGDCEDRACLMASLMLASGISNFNVRVAVGKLRQFSSEHVIEKEYDHAWVMYKNEKGRWMVFEPLYIRDEPSAEVTTDDLTKIHSSKLVEYKPEFLFNDAHLWRVRYRETAKRIKDCLAQEWNRLDTTFAGQVHRSIVLDEALKGVAPAWVTDALKRYFISVPFSSKAVDIVDNPYNYDPLDHFDNGYINESWDRINYRLGEFRKDNHNLRRFAYAAHSIADFYAHTSYVHFAKPDPALRTDETVELYDPQNPDVGFLSPPDYSANSNFDLTSNKFTINPYYWKKSKAEAANQWKGQILSGRYAQHSDSHDMIEWVVQIPDSLEHRSEFAFRGSLPHHNEIAVDEAALSDGSPHKLYSKNGTGPSDPMWFVNQYKWRKNTAVKHIRDVFKKNWKG